MKGITSNVWRALKDAVVPPQCLGCGLAIAEAGHLCGSCWLELQFIDAPCCARLGVPLEADLGPESVCARALMDPPVWARARAAVVYDRLARDIVHGFKYHDRMENAAMMTRVMARAGSGLLAEADLIVPVPLHRWRLWWRRFNQAAVLAQGLARAASKPWAASVLVRPLATRAQVGLKAGERRANLRDAFAVPNAARALVKGRRVLLIDDVLTTGSTATAAGLALLEAGAAAVDVLVFALVPEPSGTHIQATQSASGGG